MSDRSALPGLRVQLLDPAAQPPARAHAEDAGYDLVSVEAVQIPPHQRVRVRTGIAVEVPEGWAGLVCPRSGLAARHGISLVNSPGVVDAGYRGEVQVLLLNTDPQEPFTVTVGMRIAQFVIVPHLSAPVTVVDDLSATSRGEGGFGSTGVQADTAP